VTEPGFFDRWGEAVIAPRRGLARADAAALGGRPGIDLIKRWRCVVALAVAHTRAVVGAGWIALELGPRAAVAPLGATLTVAATVPLVVVAVAATIAVWLGAGPRRELGRDADLACVVALPPILVALLDDRARPASCGLPSGVAWRSAVIAAASGVAAGRRSVARGATGRGGAA
jgi:hypothetical protein